MPLVISRHSLLFVWWCACLWVVGTLLLAMSDALYPGPFKDMWWMMPFIQEYFSGESSFQSLLAVHGGAHRLAIPRLLFLIEYGVFHGTNTFLVCVSLLMQSVFVLVWCWQIRSMPWSRPFKLFCWSVVLLLSFSGMQFENFLYTFDCQWFLANTLSVLALCVFVGYLQTSRVMKLLLAALFGVMASISSFLGLCSLLLMVVLALLVKGRHAVSWFFAVSALLYVLWYVAGFESGSYAAFDSVGGATSATSLAVLSVRLLQWTLLYLGSPLSREVSVAGSLVASAGLLFVGIEAVRLYRRRHDCVWGGIQAFCVLVAVYAVGVAVATGLGRLYFINTANEDRYQTINLTFWLAVCLLLLARSALDGRKIKQAVWLVVVWCGYVGVWWHAKDLRARVAEFELVKASAYAQQFGVQDFNAIRDTLILGDRAKRINRAVMHNDFLQAQQWGAFAPAWQLPEAVRQTAHRALPACRLERYQVSALSERHWLVTVGLIQPHAGEVVLFDNAGEVRGVLVARRWHESTGWSVLTLAHPAFNWLGYANTALNTDFLRGVLIENSQAVCEMSLTLPDTVKHGQSFFLKE